MGNGCQKLGDIINQNTIDAALHWAEKMMIETLHCNPLFIKSITT